MKGKKSFRRILAGILSIVMVFGTLLITTTAQTPSVGTSGEIIAFEALSEEISNQMVGLGSGLGDLNLPETLWATVLLAAATDWDDPQEPQPDPDEPLQQGGSGTPAAAEGEGEIVRDPGGPPTPSGGVETGLREITISVPVTWTPQPAYSPGSGGEEPGEYIFTAQLDGAYTLIAGVSPPQITVTTVIEPPAPAQRGAAPFGEGSALRDWEDVRAAIDGADDGDVIDLSGLTAPADSKVYTFEVSDGKTLTLKGGDAMPADPVENVAFVFGAGNDITIENLNIKSANNHADSSDDSKKGYSPLHFTGMGNTLTLAGENTIASGQTGYGDNGYGAAVGVPVNAGLTITADDTHKLTATGGYYGAGIGGGYSGASGSITISGGTVTANGGSDDHNCFSASGIGGGYQGAGGTITISGGIVTATGGGGEGFNSNGGAGIGGGYQGAGGTITISGGTVKAVGGGEGYGGAGIGGGYNGDGGKISISGGANVNAEGGVYGAGIGGGRGKAAGTIDIQGGTVTAKGRGNFSGAGIGGGYYGAGGEISISGGVVTATVESDGAGIGGGYKGAGGKITINGGTVDASSDGGAGIGGGNQGAGGEISINGGTVDAASTSSGAGIGGGAGGDGGEIRISGGIVTARGGASSYGGAGIGGGRGGTGGEITISGGTVNATGRSNGAGIGGGGVLDSAGGAGGTVKISGGSVKAKGGRDAEDIGHGANATDSGSLTNGNGKNVYRNTLTRDGLVNTAVTGASYGESNTPYGTQDVWTDDDGKLYFYLPTSDEDETVEVTTAGNQKYVAEYTRQADHSNKANLSLGSLRNAVVTIVGTPTYTGSDLSPDVIVTLDGSTLTRGTDYIVNYEGDCINAVTTTAKVIVTGKDNYTGKKEQSFTIAPKLITITPTGSQGKTYGENDPDLTFTNDGGLNESDFTGALSRAGGEDAGNYPILSGTLHSVSDNYELTLNSIEVTFEIRQATVTGITSTVSDVDKTAYEMRNHTTAQAVVDAAGLPETVEVTLNSGGTVDLAITWATSTDYNARDATYSVIGTLTGTENIGTGGITDSVTVTVTPVTVATPTFDPINIVINDDPAATAADLGNTILPTSSSINVDVDGEGTIESIPYTIEWSDSQTLDRTDVGKSQTFTGTINTTESWLTLGDGITISRKVVVIDKEEVILSGITTPGKIYNGTACVPDGTVSVSGNHVPVENLEWLYASADGGAYSSSTAPTDAGAYKLTISVPKSNPDYKGSVVLNFNIDRAIFVVSDFIYTPPESLTYEGTAKTADVSFNLSGKDGYGNLAIKYEGLDGTSYPVSETPPSDVGSYKVTVSTTGSTNYTDVTDLQLGSFSITKAVLTADSFKYTAPTSLTYDGTGKDATVVYKESLTGAGTIMVFYTGISGTSYDTSTSAPINAGSYKVTVSTTGSTNYTDVTDLQLDSFDIAKVWVTITPVSGQSKAYGQDDPALNFTPSSALFSGDSFTGALSRAAGDDVGDYAITQGDLSASPNYTLNFTDGVMFTITKAEYPGSPITATRDVFTNFAQIGMEVDMSGLLSGITGASVSGVTKGDDTANIIDNISYEENKVIFDVNSVAEADKTATINVTVSSTNYNDFIATITVKAVDKSPAGVSFEGTVPSARTYGDGDFTLTANAAAPGQNGTWTWESSNSAVLKVTGNGAGASVEILKSGNAAITVKYESDNTLGEASTAAITVAKAALTVQPKSLSIYTGEALPALEVIYSGLKSNDTDDAIILSGGTLEMEIRKADGSPLADSNTAGDYPIVFTATPNFSESDKYVIAIGQGSLIISNKPSDGGGGSSDSSTDQQSAAPAANDAVSVGYTTFGGTATLSLPTAKVNEIIEKSKDGEVVIDLSEVKGTNAASLPKAALEAFEDAGLDLTIKLPTGTVTLDTEMAAAVAKQADSNLTIELKQVTASDLTSAQKNAINDGDIVLDINIHTGTGKITGFDGKLTVQVPYNGPEPVAVWYLNDQGELEKLDCTYKDGVVSFNTDHLSLYVVGKDTETAWINPFTDVAQGAWYYGAVKYASENGLMAGTGSNSFSPHASTTRAMIVTILHRLEGTPDVRTKNSFTDVASDQWYANAVIWAAGVRVVNGYGDGKFGPGDAITREQMAAILMNYAQLKGYDRSARADLSKYSDSASVSSWATDAMTWANAEGLIQGDGTKLMPTGHAERCQAAAIFRGFIENIARVNGK